MFDLLERNHLDLHNGDSVEDTSVLAVKKVLLDLSHGELLSLEEAEKLCVLLRDRLGYEVATHLSDKGPLEDGILDPERFNIIVLFAPTYPLTPDEIEAIEQFVSSGGSLLVATHFDSLHPLQSNRSINRLLGTFKLQAQQRVGYTPGNIDNLSAHYLSSGIRRLEVDRYATSIVPADSSSNIVATFSVAL